MSDTTSIIIIVFVAKALKVTMAMMSSFQGPGFSHEQPGSVQQGHSKLGRQTTAQHRATCTEGCLTHHVTAPFHMMLWQ
jgi:hypothetical protein